MGNANKKIISSNELKELTSKIDFASEEELIEIHKSLIGVECKDKYEDIKDCGVYFIRSLLYRDFGRNYVYNYSIGAKNFIKSKYLSDYYKSSIKAQLLEGYLLSEDMLCILNSDKTINDMSAEEIGGIYDSLKKYYLYYFEENYRKIGIEPSVTSHFMALLYNLDGEGVTLFKECCVPNSALVSEILTSSGIFDRSIFYSGRGVHYDDLNENHLVEIFNKLLVIDINYAINFVEMVKQMPTLGATEFIDSLNWLAAKDFIFDTSPVTTRNVYGVYDRKISSAPFTPYPPKTYSDEDYQVEETERIKRAFLAKIKPILLKVNSNYDDDQSFDPRYPKRPR